VLLWLGAAALALVGIWLAFVAVWLTRPIRQLEAAATCISAGDLDVKIDVRTDDEIGRTAQAFIGMRSYLQETAQAAGRIAGGDLTADIEARSDRDVLRHAFATMTGQLRGVVGQITEAAQTAAQEEMGASCRSLTHTATELQRLVAQFRTVTPGDYT